MRVGVLAEKTGVSRDTIRLYETMGLLRGISRPYEYNNYKEYSEDNVDRIQFILTMKELGLSLKECKTVIETIENNQFDKDFQEQFINDKLNEIDKKINELLKLKSTLMQHFNRNCDNVEIVDKIKDSRLEDED
ncbi:MAG: MerR family transcriptional regulator [Carboxylicivirga sp.]|jgi:DNA-binding transcriptional MerR regulator|nr:MerR family transcriptional regulator [Carboxylicivirga sp.]